VTDNAVRRIELCYTHGMTPNMYDSRMHERAAWVCVYFWFTSQFHMWIDRNCGSFNHPIAPIPLCKPISYFIPQKQYTCRAT